MKYQFILLAICGLLHCYDTADGATRVEAVDEFIRSIIAKELPKSGNSFEWDASGNGGYLVRHLVDVTGDGQAELILISTLASTSNFGEWTVFDIAPSGEMRPYVRSISLMAGAVSLALDDKVTELRCEWPPDFDSEEGMKNRLLPEGTVKHKISRFVFSFPDVIEKVDYVTDLEAEKIRSQALDTKPKLESIMLADYLMDANATWSVVPEWVSNSDNRFFRPEDAEKLKSYSTFTPYDALLAIEKSVKHKEPTYEADSKQTISNESIPTTHFWPWIAGACLILLAIGMMLKRRS